MTRYFPLTYLCLIPVLALSQNERSTALVKEEGVSSISLVDNVGSETTPFSTSAVHCRHALFAAEVISDANGIGSRGSFVSTSSRESGPVKLFIFQAGRITATELNIPIHKKGLVRLEEDPSLIIDRYFDFQQILGFTYVTLELPQGVIPGEQYEALPTTSYADSDKIARSVARRYILNIFEISPKLARLSRNMEERGLKPKQNTEKRDIATSDVQTTPKPETILYKALEACSSQVLWGYEPNPIAPIRDFLGKKEDILEPTGKSGDP